MNVVNDDEENDLLETINAQKVANDFKDAIKIENLGVGNKDILPEDINLVPHKK